MSILDRLRGRSADRPLDCRAVGRVLQSVLDAETDDDLAGRVADHLEACRDCGLEADTYLRIKGALATDAAVDPTAAARLRDFGARLARGDGPVDGPGPA